MRTVVRQDDALRRIQRSCDEAASGAELFERLSNEMHELIPHDGAVWFGADPVTLLATSPIRIEAMEASSCDLFWHNEFHTHDTAQYVDLARAGDPAAALRLSLGGSPVRSTRFRELLAPAGYDDELRSVLRSGENTWGLMGLFRARGHGSFTPDEVAIAGKASPIIGAALRNHVRGQNAWLGSAQAPGLVIFDDRSRVISANAEAMCWLRELIPGDPELEKDPVDDGPPLDAVQTLLHADELHHHVTPLWALLNRSRAIGCGLDDRPARLRLRDRRGRWLVLHGSCLATADEAAPESVAIVIEPAKSSEIAPIIIEAYSLTTRERDVVGAIARGDSTQEIANRLFLSPHTVRDHIKTVFEKVEVSSRAELVAKLFAEHYEARAHVGAAHID